jgi:hypothetical protein
VGRLRPQGYYCTGCGERQPLGEGAISCRSCGKSGLCGFDGTFPRRLTCTQDGCSWTGWHDGVNSWHDLPNHLRDAHGIPQPCEFCKGTGRRKLRRKAGVTWADCRCCKGAGRYAQIGHAPASGAR